MDNKENFIEKSKIKYDNFYIYDKVDYVNLKTPVEIICPIHGNYFRKPSEHLYDKLDKVCPNCMKNKRISNKRNEFIEKFYNKYDIQNYKLIEIEKYYKNSRTPIPILCSKHGIIHQTPTTLISKSCCAKCGKDRAVEYGVKNNKSWHYTVWGERATISKNFESFKIYLLKFENEKESFYKVGKTFMSIENRIKYFKNTTYTVSLIDYKIFDISRECSEYENYLKIINKDMKYKPMEKFRGYSECFSNIDKYDKLF